MKFMQAKKTLPFHRSKIKEQIKFSYSSLGKAFEKETKTTQEQERKQTESNEEHGKVVSSIQQ